MYYEGELLDHYNFEMKGFDDLSNKVWRREYLAEFVKPKLTDTGQIFDGLRLFTDEDMKPGVSMIDGDKLIVNEQDRQKIMDQLEGEIKYGLYSKDPE